MKRLDERKTRERKQLTLQRETLRRLDARELEQVAGASAWPTCGTRTGTVFEEPEH